MKPGKMYELRFSINTQNISRLPVLFNLAQPGSLRPLRTVRATFTAYSSGPLKASPMMGDPAVFTAVIRHKSSNLFAFYS